MPGLGPARRRDRYESRLVVDARATHSGEPDRVEVRLRLQRLRSAGAVSCVLNFLDPNLIPSPVERDPRMPSAWGTFGASTRTLRRYTPGASLVVLPRPSSAF